ncbi:MAG TPA: EF-hand domain-containing protein [Pseudonocardiaceae bacterium]|nr:EF-hand domain-containing protein [Pseudonocardiaceae bacterium]
MDADGDGRISEEELLASVQHGIVDQADGFNLWVPNWCPQR